MFPTRPLTADETDRLINQLVIRLGVNGKDAAFRAIIDVGNIGIFAVEFKDDDAAAWIDVSEWTRLREVDNYAAAQHITRAEAINQLVNSALSHRLNEPGMGSLIARLVHDHLETRQDFADDQL